MYKSNGYTKGTSNYNANTYNLHYIKKNSVKIKIKNEHLFCIKSYLLKNLKKFKDKQFITIIGSRRITTNQISQAIIKLKQFVLQEQRVVIISGGAKGSDTLAENFALKYKILFIKILPSLFIDGIPNQLSDKSQNVLICSPKLNLKRVYIKYALLYRNKTLSNLADKIISIATPKPSGTSYTLLYALLDNKPIYLLSNPENNEGAYYLLNHNIGNLL